MPDTYLTLFVLSSLVLILTPGQDMVLVMSRSIAQGQKAGIVTAAGVSVGLLGHTILATLGVGAILQASEVLFLCLKLVGAAYLIYIGMQLLRVRNVDLVSNVTDQKSLRRLFADGALSNVSNPKITVFYLSFLPQFVSPDASNPSQQIFLLGLTFALLTFVVKAPVGYLAGRLSAWLRNRPRVLLGIYRSSGLVMFGLGLKLALERKD